MKLALKYAKDWAWQWIIAKWDDPERDLDYIKTPAAFAEALQHWSIEDAQQAWTKHVGNIAGI